MKSQLLLTLLVTILMACGHDCTQDDSHNITITKATTINVIAPEQQESASNATKSKCSRQSVIIARQTLMHELDIINSYGSLWLNDLDQDELMEEQKESLGGIMMAGLGDQLLTSDGQPLIEIEASYFRPLPSVGASINSSSRMQHPPLGSAQAHRSISIKLLRRHPDRCQLSEDLAHYTYSFGLIIGPFEHNLDVRYNLPKELRFSQPMSKKYAQIKVVVPKMQYEITVSQVSDFKLSSAMVANCPLEITDVMYLGNPPTNQQPQQQQQPNKPYTFVQASGLAATRQTILQLERLFNDHTRPTVSNRLRQALKFYLTSKTLPLSV